MGTLRRDRHGGGYGLGAARVLAHDGDALLLERAENPHLLVEMSSHDVPDFGARGWLAIDPKGLYGERGFDYANIFCNPVRARPV
jgi:streptomycin 6-kinase